MIRQLSLAILLSLSLTVALTGQARAEPIPAEYLDGEYQSCLSGQAADQAPQQVDPQQVNPQQLQYCNCVRNQMSSWDMATYARISQEAQTMDAKNPPPELNQLAQGCIAKVLH